MRPGRDIFGHERRVVLRAGPAFAGDLILALLDVLEDKLDLLLPLLCLLHQGCLALRL